MANDPNPDERILDVIQKMVRESVQIAAAESTLVEIEKFGVLAYFPDGNLKLSKKIVNELFGYLLMLPQCFIEFFLN